MKLFIGFFLGVWALTTLNAQAEESYTFDAAEFTKKTWEWKGEVSAKVASRSLDLGADLYRLKFDPKDGLQVNDAQLELVLESRWDWEWSRLYLVGAAFRQGSTQQASHVQDEALLREGYWEYAQGEPHSLQIGKRLVRWGKGYAFNPVAFLERPKSPDDPEANREGLWLMQMLIACGTWGKVINSTLTLVYLPVREDLNEDYRPDVTRGRSPNISSGNAVTTASAQEFRQESILGIKGYVLFGTTDVDGYWVRWSESDQAAIGFDFATNLSPNFEIHGEYAAFTNPEAQPHQTLLGIRYLTEKDVTWIVEGYQDTAGLTAQESSRQYKTLTQLSMVQAQKATQALQGRTTVNQNYGYVKASIKEPFDWLYFTPSLAWLRNFDDSSETQIFQVLYTPGINWTLQATWAHASGAQHTQYAANPVRSRWEGKITRSF